MCLAVPLKLISVAEDGRSALAAAGSTTIEVGLELTPEARPGDYVLVHAGMAIELIDAAEAQATLAVLREYTEIPGMLEPGQSRPADD